MHVVVAGVLVRADRVLLGHRSPERRWYPDVWDLPGGHVEPGESELQALARELREELGVRIDELSTVALARLRGPADVDAEAMELGIWCVRSWRGGPVNLCPDEHDRIGWFTASGLGGLALAHPGYAGLLRPLMAQR